MIFSNKGKKTWETDNGFNNDGTRFFNDGNIFRGAGQNFWDNGSFMTGGNNGTIHKNAQNNMLNQNGTNYWFDNKSNTLRSSKGDTFWGVNSLDDAARLIAMNDIDDDF